VKWQKSETADFSSPIDVNVSSTTLSAGQIGPLFNTTYFRAVVQNSSCTEVISNSVSLTIEDTSWNGSAWSNGNPTACKKVIINNGGSYITAGNSITAGTLTINNATSFTISSEDYVELEGPLVVEQGSTFIVSNNSNLIQNNNVINQGTISVVRQSAPLMRLDYVMWSAPVVGQNLLAFSPQTVTNRFYTYNPATNIYNVIAPASNSFQPGTGYLIRMPNNHPTSPTIWTGTFTGVPNNGNINLTLTNNTYNAVGNPYPSTIDADEFISQNNISEALYFWRKTNNANTSSYATYTLAGGTGTEPNSGDPLALIPNGIIQVGQGFIVRSTSTELQFNNSMRLHDTQNQLLRVSNNKSRMWLNVNGEQEMSHQTMIAYMPGTTLGEDAGYDGRYFNDSPNALTSLIGVTEYAVQARGDFEVTDEVPLGFKTQTAGNYTISIGNLDGLFTGEQNIYLRDLFFGTDHDLKASAYTFSSDAGTFNERFRVVFQNTLSTPTVNESSNLIAFVRNKELILDAGTELMSDVKIYDVRGSLVFEAKLDTTNFNAHLLVQGKQILLVQVTFQNGTTVVKKVAY
jgi:trimeric autotransporter adhesin